MIDFKYLSSANEERIYDYLNNLAKYQGCICTKSYIRFINSSLHSSIDIYIDGNMVASSLETGIVTNFMLIYPGEYVISIYASGETQSALLNKAISISKNSSYTAAFAGQIANLYIVKEEKQEVPAFREAVINFSNFAPFLGNVDLYLSDGTLLFRGLSFSESMPNILLFPNEEVFELKYSGTGEILASTEKIELQRASYYSLFSVLDENKVKLIIIKSGLNYLDLC